MTKKWYKVQTPKTQVHETTQVLAKYTASSYTPAFSQWQRFDAQDLKSGHFYVVSALVTGATTIHRMPENDRMT
mgnify:CR=1 FL=1